MEAMIDETFGPVLLGFQVKLHPGSIIIGPAELGDRVEVFPGCIIGCEAESYDRDKRETSRNRPLIIGTGTTLREKVVVQRGIERATMIGHDCYIMHGCHIAHDVQLQDYVTMAPGVILGGHTDALIAANMGIGAMTHQWVTIGQGAMVGMGSVVVKDVRPFDKVAGVPARRIGSNREVALERFGAALHHDGESFATIRGEKARRRGLERLPEVVQ